MHCVSLANNQPANYLGSQKPPHGHESPLPERLPIVLTPRVSPLDPRTLSFFDFAPLPRKQDLFPAPMTLHSPTRCKFRHTRRFQRGQMERFFVVRVRQLCVGKVGSSTRLFSDAARCWWGGGG